MSFLTSCAADASIIANWVFYSQQEFEDPFHKLLLILLLCSLIGATLVYLLLVSDCRPLAWFAKKCHIRVSTGMVMFFGVVIDDIPQIVISIILDSAAKGQVSTCGDVGVLAVFNILTAAYDALIKFAEAYDTLSDKHATGYVDLLIARLQADDAIEKADFSGRNLKDAEVSAISEGLSTNTHVTIVLMRDTGIRCASMLAKGLKKNRDLLQLDLSKNRITGKELAKLIGEWKENKNTNVTKLFLQENSICNAGLVPLAAYLKENAPLEELDLSNNRMKGKMFRDLWVALSFNSKLVTLTLSCNNVGDEGCFAIDNLKKNTALTHLSLDGIGLSKADKVAEMLKGNRTLTELSLKDNTIADVGPLADALGQNKSLLLLSLDRNQIVAVSKLAEMLRLNSRLQTLSLTGNEILDAGAKQFASALSGPSANKTLKHLDLESTGIQDVGALAFVEVIKTNKTLSKLCLCKNCFDSATIGKLQEQISKSKSSLRVLDLGTE